MRNSIAVAVPSLRPGLAPASSSALRRPTVALRSMRLETNKPIRETQPENRDFRVRKMGSTIRCLAALAKLLAPPAPLAA